ncbi:sialic acid-binding Ig-like lectin 6 isoform X1 [Rousettus aegyptiacus]|uniref:sialic acid-binding Ig-like lectin 6 isoform X1 n=1 Tax=Rousettus aegyptiacus TaxID=9407 RepID=UPI00168D19FA|nr:sialic acid-binding Ig-like lectin 6 isoform X1 [Rousettus aegyptiacus]
MLLRSLLLLPVLWEGLLTQHWRYRLDLPESVTVKEGLCVLVPCQFFYPSTFLEPLYMFWFQKGVDMNDDLLVATNKPQQKLQERARGRFFLPRDPQPNNCSLTIIDVNRWDSGMYFLQMEKRSRIYSFQNQMFSLKVTALTHTPNILIPETLESGRPSNVICSVPWACERSMAPTFSWMSAALSSMGPRTHLSLGINLTPWPQDHGTSLTCQVYFPAAGATVERTVQLNVTYAPRDVAISVFQGNSTALRILQSTSSLPILQGEALLLLCSADSNPPADLSWFRGPAAPNATPISSTGILELPRVGAAEEGEFTCQIQHPLGSRNISLRVSMVYKLEPRANMVTGVIKGAAIVALLSLCLCLICRLKSPGWFLRVKTHGKKAAQPVHHLDNVVGSGSKAHRHQFWADSLSGHRGHDDTSSVSEERQELHYAFLRFHKPKPQQQEDASTEYSEIKVHK